MVAEVTWHGVSTSYRVHGFVFRRGRAQYVTSETMIQYAKTTKGFTVVDISPEKQPEAIAQATPDPEPVTEPEPTPDPEPVADEDAARRPAKLPKKRFLK